MIALTVVGVAAATMTRPEAQSKQFRRGGPRDWSQNRLIAARFGPDLDQNIERDWRTHVKHVHLEQARARALSPTLDWFDLLQQAFGAKKPKNDPEPHLDWNLKTGGTGNVVGAPAKYTFDITTANCTDVIYFTVDQAGGA